MLRTISFYALMLCFLSADTSSCRQKAERIILSGTIQLAPGFKPMAYLLKPTRFGDIAQTYAAQIIDSVRIAPDGHFAFPTLATKLTEPTLVCLCVQRNETRHANQLDDADPRAANYFPLVLGPDSHFEITAIADALQKTYQISQADQVNKALLNLRDLRLSSFQTNAVLLLPDTTHDESLLIPRAEALVAFRQPLMAFADSCSAFEPAMMAIRWTSPSADYERVPEFMVHQCEKWQKLKPEHPWVGYLCAIGSREKMPVLIGDLIPKADLPMASGDTLPMQSLLGKKCTVLDIWASWCAPCRRENREVLLPLWQKYHANGLQIVGYSIDGSAAPWKAAIQRDGAAWSHASHLTGDSTPLLDALRISTIPSNFILDSEGRVIAKNLHGEELAIFLDRLFRS